MTILALDIINEARTNTKLVNPAQVSNAQFLNWLNLYITLQMPQSIQDRTYKTVYRFTTVPNQAIYQVDVNAYTQLVGPVFLNGQVILTYQDADSFHAEQQGNIEPVASATGNGGLTYSWIGIAAPILPGGVTQLGQIVPGLFINTIDTAGVQLNVNDDGKGNLIGDGTGTVNYITGAITVTFNSPTFTTIWQNNFTYTSGQSNSALIYDNAIVFYVVPDKPYLAEVVAYIQPQPFANVNSPLLMPYMFKLLVYGTAQYALREYKDDNQLRLIDNLYRQQENLLMRRTERQDSNVRVSCRFNTPNYARVWQTNNPATGQ